MIKEITLEENCVGCGQCVSTCPNHAIEMCESEEGFYYPVIDSVKCVECNKCISSCIGNQSIQEVLLDETESIYGYINSNKVMSSQSGGFCTAVSEQIIREGGIVFGAAYSKDFFSVVYIGIEKEEDLVCLQGSKYIQAKPGNYEEILEQLNTGRKVLVIGLPCFVDSVVLWAKDQYPNLLTIALICHGPTSNLIHRRFLEEHSRGTIRSFSIKKKKQNRYSGYTEIVSDIRYLRPFRSTSYSRLFNLVLRKSCYNCQHKLARCKADVMAGDYWPEDALNRCSPYGNSAVIILRKKDEWKSIIDKIPSFVFSEVNLDDLIRQNPALVHPAKDTFRREEAIAALKKNICLKKICTGSIKKRTISCLSNWFVTYCPAKTQIQMKKWIRRKS